MLDSGVDTIEVTAETESAWVSYHEKMGERTFKLWQECTPSYFNQEGSADRRVLRNGGYGGSIMELRDIMTKWRDDEGMPGLTMTTKAKS